MAGKPHGSHLSQMAAIARAWLRAFPTNSLEAETLKQIALLCAAGLLVSLLLMTYGLDLSPGFSDVPDAPPHAEAEVTAGGQRGDISVHLQVGIRPHNGPVLTKRHAFLAYADNNLIDVKPAIIVGVIKEPTSLVALLLVSRLRNTQCVSKPEHQVRLPSHRYWGQSGS